MKLGPMKQFLSAWRVCACTCENQLAIEHRVDGLFRYMFSGQFTEENPDIDDDMPEFLDLLAKLPYVHCTNCATAMDAIRAHIV